MPYVKGVGRVSVAEFQIAKNALASGADPVAAVIQMREKITAADDQEKDAGKDRSGVPSGNMPGALAADLEKRSEKDSIPTVNGEIVAASSGALPDGFGDVVENWLADYAARYNVDLNKMDSQQWRSACIYIGEKIKSLGVLRDQEKEKRTGARCYDGSRLEALLYLWAFFTGTYKQVPLVPDFVAFSGVHRNYFYDYDGRGLSSTCVQIVKKAREIEKAGLLSCVVGGRSNAVGGIYLSKALHQLYDSPTGLQMIDTAPGPAASAAAIPVFDQDAGLLTDKSGVNVDN